jgi:cytochrome b
MVAQVVPQGPFFRAAIVSWAGCKIQAARGNVTIDIRCDNPAMLIWDLPLRVFHWLLVVTVVGCWATYELGIEYFTWHRWLGYVALVLVAFRVLWGFAGPRHARFAGFIRGPRAWWQHARTLTSRSEEHYPGHSPLGGVMILLLLVLVAALGITGLFANDEIMNNGPLYGYVSDAASDSLSRLHRQLMDYLWVAIGLHVAAILGYLLVKRQDLLTPMFTGRKRARWLTPADEVRSSRILLALALAALAALLLYVAVSTAPEPSIFLF